MLPINCFIFILVVLLLIFFVLTYTHYLVHKYYNKDLVCYIENNTYLLRYDIIDILISNNKNLNIKFEYIDTYGFYIEKYIYKKYIKTIKE